VFYPHLQRHWIDWPGYEAMAPLLMPLAGPICPVNGFGISHSQLHQTD
jgi:hypothetical protein